MWKGKALAFAGWGVQKFFWTMEGILTVILDGFDGRLTEGFSQVLHEKSGRDWVARHPKGRFQFMPGSSLHKLEANGPAAFTIFVFV